MANDSTNTTGEKIDYYSILKRRKRTVNGFISEFGITSLKDLNRVLVELGKEYNISEEFRKLAVLALPSTPIPSAPALDVLSDFVTEPVSDVDVNHVQKPKKRYKKESL